MFVCHIPFAACSLVSPTGAAANPVTCGSRSTIQWGLEAICVRRLIVRSFSIHKILSQHDQLVAAFSQGKCTSAFKMPIQPLPPEVIAQIKSSIDITSLNGVICELVKNSLDAASTKIDIAVDYARGGCVVEDDGLGIPPTEFGEAGGLGKLYHSSKLNGQAPMHGGRGTFLATLSAMAFLTITSHHHLHRSHNAISMHKSEVVSRQTPASVQQYLSHSDHGTRVTVRDLFGNMPVRVKQRAILTERRGSQREWEDLRRDVVMLLLSWPGSISLKVRELDGNQKLSLRPIRSSGIAPSPVSQVCGFLTQAGLITPEEKKSWVPVGISTSSLDIHGFISLQPSAVKHVQFIAFGVHPLKVGSQSLLHDEINKLFCNSSFGNEEEVIDLDDNEQVRRAKDQRIKGEVYTQKELKGRKGVEKWPMFYLNIGLSSSAESARQVHTGGDLNDTPSKFGAISELLQVVITKFLTLHHFLPKQTRGKRSKRRDGKNAPDAILVSPGRTLDPIQPSAKITKLSSKQTPSTFDPLGTNVNLPSFRRSQIEADTVLDGLSRIKSGFALVNTEAKGQPVQSAARPSSAPPPQVSEKHFTAKRSNTPLIAGDGKILRRPFDDTVCVARPKSVRISPPIPEMSRTADGEDKFVEWVHPVTKVRCMMNKRTGMAIPHKDEWSGPRISQKPSLSDSASSKSTKTTSTSSTWIKYLLQNWENPVFASAEPAIPQINLEGPDQQSQRILHGRHHHCSQVDVDHTFKQSLASVSGRISKAALQKAEVIAQVDRKFILVTIQANSSGYDEGVLILVDQHAADERIRVEALLESFCKPPEDAALLGKSSVTTTLLKQPLVFEVSIREISVLKEQRKSFAYWGIIYEVSLSRKESINTIAIYRLSVLALPPGIVERCKQEPRLLIELIRSEAWQAHEYGKAIPSLVSADSLTWLQRIQNCPQGILDMLNSRACRGAIMFNDELSRSQCETLVRRLADCKFPFQCAHGRPSLMPLVDMSTLKGASDEESQDEGKDSIFGHAFRKWRQSSK